jgi:DNA polymerase-4
MFEIMEHYSPIVEAASVDEGYVDLGGTLRLHNAAPWEVAGRMLAEIRSTLGINVSGGLAGTKTFAKMATSLAKPNGLIYLEPAGAVRLLGALSVGKIPGVGKRAQELLERRGIVTVADLAATPRSRVKSIVGNWGEKLVEIARGHDNRRVRAEPRLSQKSYSKQRTLEKDISDYQTIRYIARELAEKLSAKLRKHHKGACVITFRVRYADFKETGRSVTIRHPTSSTLEIQEQLDRLIGRTITRRTPIRKVGVMLSGIEAPVSQDDLFEPNRHRKHERDLAVDRIRSRFGFEAVWVSGRPHQ